MQFIMVVVNLHGKQLKKAKAVPIHTIKMFGGRGGIAPTQS
jgi:hypothetical protein